MKNKKIHSDVCPEPLLEREYDADRNINHNPQDENLVAPASSLEIDYELDKKRGLYSYNVPPVENEYVIDITDLFEKKPKNSSNEDAQENENITDANNDESE